MIRDWMNAAGLPAPPRAMNDAKTAARGHLLHAGSGTYRADMPEKTI
jgi:hypothetical protein